MSDGNHSIIINNYKNNDILCYSCVLIKGTILTDYTSVCNKINKLLNIKNGNKTLLPQVYNNKFKCLIPLNLNENKIILTYCCYSLELILNFVPRVTNYCVVPMYIICKNHYGNFQAPNTENNSLQSACNRISVGVNLIQTLVAEKFYENGLERKTFQLENDLLPQVPKCRIFHSKLDYKHARKMNQYELWSYFGREIMEADSNDNNVKYLAFISCTRYRGDKFGPNIKNHDDIVKITEAHVALGGGGLALFGSACLYTWPEKLDDAIKYFLNEDLVDKTKYMDDSCYRGTIGGCFATTLGAVCHELCHTFDLGHTPDGIMGRGFDNIDKEFIFEKLKKVIKPNKNEEQTGRKIKDDIKVTQTVAPRSGGLKYKPPVFKKIEEKNFNNEGIFWSPNCIVLLYYHRWLNSEKICLEDSDLELQEKTLLSSSGIRIIEIRDTHSEMLIKWWNFSDSPVNIFRLEEFTETSFVLVAENTNGTILKQLFNS